MNTSLANMAVYAAKWNEKPSFRMMSIHKDCPYNEAIFDPEQKILAVISKDSKDKPMMMPRLSDKGDIIPTKRADGNQGWQEQRVVIPAYYEYYLEDINDIVAFVQRFAVNHDSKVFSDILHSAFELGTYPHTEEQVTEIKENIKKAKEKK
jgi:hypothetical protein